MEQLTKLLIQPRAIKVQNGRKQTTGKYETRKELVSNIARMLEEGRLSKSSIARVCKVSCGTVDSIVDSMESNI